MPGLLSLNRVLPAFPNVWPYNTERFANAELSVKLQMSQKLVVTAKKSLFFVVANGPREGEELVFGRCMFVMSRTDCACTKKHEAWCKTKFT